MVVAVCTWVADYKVPFAGCISPIANDRLLLADARTLLADARILLADARSLLAGVVLLI